MTVYLTFNDSPSGVYASQVIDVVNYLSAEQKQPVKLVAFVSIRNFRASRHKIKRLCPNAIVLPMFPGVKNWKMNRITLKTIFGIVRPKTVVARGIFATHLAFRVRKVRKPFKLVFDARGAYHAEFSEYRLIEDDHFIEEVRVLEQQALHRSDAQLAVSNALVKYWQSNYGFNAPNVRVIPCTLAGSHSSGISTNAARAHLRSNAGIKSNEAVLVYSGSAAGWQSMEPLLNWLAKMMRQQSHLRLLLLTPMQSLKNTSLEPFEDRVLLKWVTPAEVPELLTLGDYGLLLRTKSVTNQVASPTKFAEYLAAGLQILVSPEVGDFSEFTIQHACGKVVDFDQFPELPPVQTADRHHANNLAAEHFSKERYLDDYQLLLDPKR